ncbi:SAM-dependent methyltransferase [Deinococcus sp. HMF7604]|uniref:HsdM family class I SAM-dependent methyltransferase n=1 Tax=Deinococcus betulae TaxID=2873312 RepID=UPI001CCD836C|nr:N-6 DNA methylase [Deinococcus betulae]MBZ9752698.1 SAM-dependent methyltransferase [Deinococcus betulae]
MTSGRIIADAFDQLRLYTSQREASEHIALLLLISTIGKLQNDYMSLGLKFERLDEFLDLYSTNTIDREQILIKTIEDLQYRNPHIFIGLTSIVNNSIPARVSRDTWKMLQALPLPTLEHGLISTGPLIEDLLRRGAVSDREGKTLVTPEPILRLMVGLTYPQEGQSIHDPTCGAGSCLIAAARYVASNGGDPTNLRLSGQDINPRALALCGLNLAAHGLINVDLRQGDTLAEPKFVDAQELEQFDLILTTPPLGLKQPTPPFRSFGRWHPSMLSKSRADVAFLLHAAAATKQGGKVALLAPLSLLFRTGVEADARESLLRAERVEAVISLPPGALPYSNVSTALVVLRAQEMQKPVWMFNAQSVLLNWREEDRAAVIDNVNSILEDCKNAVIGHLSRPVSFDELDSNNFNLDPNVFVKGNKLQVDPESIFAELKMLEESFVKADEFWKSSFEKMIHFID